MPRIEHIGDADLADIAEEAEKLATTVAKRSTEMLAKAGINADIQPGNLAELVRLYLARQFRRGRRAAEAEARQTRLPLDETPSASPVRQEQLL